LCSVVYRFDFAIRFVPARVIFPDQNRMSSSITILGGNQALGYEFETRLARLKAEDLINELFDEVEQNASSPEVLAAELLAFDTTSDLFEPLDGWEQPDLPSLTQDDCLAVSFVPYSHNDQPFTDAFSSTQHLTAAAAATETKNSSESCSKTGINYRVLFGMACVSLAGVGAVTLSLIHQLYWSKPAATVVTAPVSTPQVDPATVQFAQYLERAFESANRQAAAQPTPTVVSAAPTTETRRSASGQPVERIYVPVYQPQTPQARTVPASVAGAPRATGLPLPPPPQARVPARLPSAVQGYVPNRPSRPSTRLARPPLTTAVVPAPATSAPESTVIGVMELGDRSVAMIELNGATQRVSVGQTLDSGWQLMQIADQKVIMQRGGEVRALTVGQKF
jgi:hypothetical protein